MDNKPDSVTKDRNKFLGGSEIATVLGISKYQTRWELLLEKLGVIVNDFEGNSYTTYGNIMEPKIREYLNELNPDDDKFKEDCLILEKDKIRCNVDGVNRTKILEIKTSTKPNLKNKTYLAQLLFYMICYKKDIGVLAVYENENFDERFKHELLKVKQYTVEEIEKELGYTSEELMEEVAKFWKDFDTLKGYSDLGVELTQDLIIDNEIELLSNQVVALELRLKEFKAIEKENKEIKEKLYQAMKENNVKKWEMVNGTKITRVDEQNITKKVLDKNKLAKDINLEEYMKEETVHKKGYVMIKNG